MNEETPRPENYKSNDETIDYFSKLMTGDIETEMVKELQRDFNQVLTVMLFKLIERCFNKICKDGEYPEIKKIIEKFPDYALEAWLFRVKNQCEKDLNEYNSASKTSTGQLMGGLFSSVLNVEEHVGKYKKAATDLAESYRTILKARISQ